MVVGVALLGCSASGNGGDRRAPGASPSTSDCRRAGVTLRRLTRVEYNNTVRDLVGETAEPGNAFPGDVTSKGDKKVFDNNVDTLTVSDLLVKGYADAAAAIVKKAWQATSTPAHGRSAAAIQ